MSIVVALINRWIAFGQGAVGLAATACFLFTNTFFCRLKGDFATGT